MTMSHPGSILCRELNTSRHLPQHVPFMLPATSRTECKPHTHHGMHKMHIQSLCILKCRVFDYVRHNNVL